MKEFSMDRRPPSKKVFVPMSRVDNYFDFIEQCLNLGERDRLTAINGKDCFLIKRVKTDKFMAHSDILEGWHVGTLDEIANIIYG